MKYKELSANTVAFISCNVCLQLMKATVLAESPLYFILQLMKATVLAKSPLYFILQLMKARVLAESSLYFILQLMKATMLAESSLYFIFSPDSVRHSDVYRHESGRCCTLAFFLTFTGFCFILKQRCLLARWSLQSVHWTARVPAGVATDSTS